LHIELLCKNTGDTPALADAPYPRGSRGTRRLFNQPCARSRAPLFHRRFATWLLLIILVTAVEVLEELTLKKKLTGTDWKLKSIEAFMRWDAHYEN